MKDRAVTTPASVFKDLHDAYVPRGTPQGACLELSIRIADEDLSLRELSAFLDLIDRIYGRLSEKGLPSYAQREHDHLKISRLQKGSWELILQEAVSSPCAYALIVILLAVKYLPPAAQSLATAYNQLEQGRLARANRQRIKADMAADKALLHLSVERRGQLSELLDYLHEKERDKLSRAIRFTQKRVLSIEVRIAQDAD